MKSRALLLAIALLVSHTATVAAQTYLVPKPLSLDKAVTRELSTWTAKLHGASGLMTERFYPIGWSRDGKFAYVREPVDEACGCYFADLVIQGMGEDTVLWEFKYDQDSLRDKRTGKMPPEDNLAKLWRKNQKLFARKLRQYGIVPTRSVLGGTKYKTREYEYEAGAYFKRNADDTGVEDWQIQFWTYPWQGAKIIFQVDPDKKDHLSMLDGAVLGLIKSPFQRRVAVIAMEVNPGWEGPPHVGNVRVVGVDFDFGEP